MKVWALYFENGYLFLSNKPFSQNGDKFYPPIDSEHTYFAVNNKEIK